MVTHRLEIDNDTYMKMKDMMDVQTSYVVYVDGACRRNPGKSGCGVAFFKKLTDVTPED